MVIAEVILMVAESYPPIMLSVMLALCFMLFIPYYAKNYAGIIDTRYSSVLMNDVVRI